MRVYLAAFGSGMGHATRMAAVGRGLVASGNHVAFSSSGDVAGWLRSRGFPCNDIPLADVVFDHEGAFSAIETLKFSPVIMGRLCEQVQCEIANLRSFSPDVVVSDTMITTVLASWVLGIRTIAVVNQMRLFSSPRTPRAFAQVLTGTSVTLVNAFWERCDQILIPDLPPPFTISERNLWHAGSASERARYVGFLSPGASEEGEDDPALAGWREETRKRKVFWQISGPKATRGPLLSKAVEIAKALEEECLFVITAGDPVGDTTPAPIPGGFLYRWCECPGQFIRSCDSLVSRAGHVSISEFVRAGKPCLLVPIMAQTEQIGNALKAQKLGFALAMDERTLTPGSLMGAFRELSRGQYSRKAEELRMISEGHDAVKTVLTAIGAG